MANAEQRRRVTAVAFIIMLAVAEASRVRQNVDAARASESWEVETTMAEQSMAAHVKEVSPEQVKFIGEQYDAMKASTEPKMQEQAKPVEVIAAASKFDENAEVISEHLKGMLDHPKLQEQAKLIGEQVEAMMADPALQEQALLVGKQIQAARAEPKLQELAKLLADEMETMANEPNSEEHSRRVAEQVQAMMAEPAFEEHAKLVGEQMEAMMAAPKLQEQAEHFGEQVEAIQADPKLQEQASLLAEQIEDMMADPELQKLAEDAAEKMMSTLDDSKLQELMHVKAANLDNAGGDNVPLASPSLAASTPSSFVDVSGPTPRSAYSLASAPGKVERTRRAATAIIGALVCAWSLAQLSGGDGIAMADASSAVVEAEPGFVSKIAGAAAQGATAAFVAAILSAITEPIVNRLLVKRQTFAQAYSEIYAKDIAKFFLTTFPTNMLKFPAFEVISIIMSFTSLSGSMRGVASGALFCSIMLPVTNYRFRKSMNLPIKPSLLYQAYVPTVSRDIVYGWARGFAGHYVNNALSPSSEFEKALAFGVTIWIACIISSPGNEWRGYTLQPPAKKLPFKEYFKPVNYVRSTGIGATIMAIALMEGALVTPYVEAIVKKIR